MINSPGKATNNIYMRTAKFEKLLDFFTNTVSEMKKSAYKCIKLLFNHIGHILYAYH